MFNVTEPCAIRELGTIFHFIPRVAIAWRLKQNK